MTHLIAWIAFTMMPLHMTEDNTVQRSKKGISTMEMKISPQWKRMAAAHRSENRG